MKKGSSNNKSITKGKSVSSMQPYQDSRVTNKSTEGQKYDSKVSKVSKTNSCIKIHQPLSIQNRGNLKQSKLLNSKFQSSSNHDSRQKIQSHLQKKHSLNDNPMSFRPSQNKINSAKTKQSQNLDENKIKTQNQKLSRQNKQLKQKFYRMQETSLEDKQKIKTLIMRISQIKRQKCSQNSIVGGMSKNKTSASYAHILKTRGLTDRQNLQHMSNQRNENQTPFRIIHGAPSASHSKYSRNKQVCSNPQCQQRKRHLQCELYKQRIKCDQLEQQKKQWQRNRDQLKRQYQQLLCEIQNLRDDADVQQSFQE